MDEEDFLALESLLREQFGLIGAPELGDDRANTVRDDLDETPRLVDPRERVIQMLLALERRLAIQDAGTYRRSMAAIRQSTEGYVPERVIVEPIRRGVEPAPDLEFAVDLGSAPDLSDVRQKINRLIRDLRETPYST